MNAQAAESVDTPNPQVVSWVEQQLAIIEAQTPESLQPALKERLAAWASQASEVEQPLEQQNLELLIKNAVTLNQAMTDFTQRMTPLAQSWMLKDFIQRFWESFQLDQLETNQLQKVLEDLKEKVEHSEKEEAITNEARDKIDNELEPEMQSFLPYYFNSKERGVIYSEMAKLKTVEAINAYRQKILKAREKREKDVGKALKKILADKSNTEWGRKQLKQLTKKYGDGLVQLQDFKDVEHELDQVREIEAEFKSAQTELEAANERYKEITGKNHPEFSTEAANDNMTPEETEPENITKNETVTESFESAEAKIKVVEDLKIEAQNAATYWGERANDRQHARRGVGTTLSLLEAGAMEAYSRENYETEISGAGPEVPYNVKYSNTHGRKIPELFYDLPTDAEAFSSSMASSAASKIKTARENLSEHGRAAASLFYNNYYRDQDPNTIAPSINEFIGTCNAMISQLKAGRQVEVTAEAT